jgi:hypothetical protein
VTPACAIVLAGLCLPAPYDKVTDLEAMYAFNNGAGRAQQAVVDKLGIRIRAIQTDNIVAKAADDAPEACQELACVRYVKSCSPDGLECQIEWGEVSAESTKRFGVATVYTLEFTLAARSVVAMRAVQNALYVAPSGYSQQRVYIPVAAMTVLSSQPYQPFCDGRGQPAGCRTTAFGLFPNLKLTREQRYGLAPIGR